MYGIEKKKIDDGLFLFFNIPYTLFYILSPGK